MRKIPLSSVSPFFLVCYNAFIRGALFLWTHIFLSESGRHWIGRAFQLDLILFFTEGDQIRVMTDLHCPVFHPAPVLFDVFKNIIRIHLFFICHGLTGMRSYPFIFLSQFREHFFCFLICQWIPVIHSINARQKISSSMFPRILDTVAGDAIPFLSSRCCLKKSMWFLHHCRHLRTEFLPAR